MKNKLIFATILIILFFSLTNEVLAQAVSTSTFATINQVQALEKQISILDQTNSKILNTIYWALGGLITVFLAIVGLNFFQNFSLNKSKLDTLEKEIKSKISSGLSEINEQNKKNSDILTTNIQSKVKLEVQNSLKNFESKIKELRDDYNDINRENLIRKAFEHKTKNQQGYIMNLIYVLELDIEKNYDFRINETLKYLSTCLDEGFGNYDTFTDLQKALNKLPIEYKKQKEHIETKMKL